MNAKNQPTYLDYAATTPVDERVLEAMLPYFSQVFGNTSSVHIYGQQAEAALENARLTLAQGLNCQPGEVDLHLLRLGERQPGAARSRPCRTQEPRRQSYPDQPGGAPRRLRTAQQLAHQHGFELEYLPVDEYWAGRARRECAERLRPETALVSVMYANNEIGTINPIAEIGAVCRRAGFPSTRMPSRRRPICRWMCRR